MSKSGEVGMNTTLSNGNSAEVDTRGLPSGFDKPTGLQPSKPGGEWDSPEGRKSSEDLEAEGWSQDPDDYNRAMAKDFDNAEESSEEEAPVDLDAAPEEEVNEPAAEEEPEQLDVQADEESEAAPQETPRAQERIRQLVEERKVEKERADRLERLIEQLSKQSSVQERMFEQHQKQLQAAQEVEAFKSDLQRFREYGFDEGNLGHWKTFEAMKQAEAANARAEAIERQYSERMQQERVNNYLRAVQSGIETSLKGIEIDTRAKERLFRNAVAIAQAEQLVDPNAAVEAVMSPILPGLKASAKKVAPSKRPDPKDPVHKVIATQGKGAGRSPGKKQLAPDVVAFLK